MSSEQFERGETVGYGSINSSKVEIIAIHGEYAWVEQRPGDPFTARLDHLRKLPPPFAVVRPYDRSNGDAR
jgi:hypothetical protein